MLGIAHRWRGRAALRRRGQAFDLFGGQFGDFVNDMRLIDLARINCFTESVERVLDNELVALLFEMMCVRVPLVPKITLRRLDEQHHPLPIVPAADDSMMVRGSSSPCVVTADDLAADNINLIIQAPTLLAHRQRPRKPMRRGRGRRRLGRRTRFAPDRLTVDRGGEREQEKNRRLKTIGRASGACGMRIDFKDSIGSLPFLRRGRRDQIIA